MKKIVLLIAVLCFADISDSIVKIKEIENMQKSFLTIDNNIFAYETNVKTTYVTNEPELNLKIYAVFNNKVNINGKWYKINDEINGYKIFKITEKSVYLRKKSKILILTIKNNFIKVQK